MKNRLRLHEFLSVYVTRRQRVYAPARCRAARFRTQHVGRVTWHRTVTRWRCDSVLPSSRTTQTGSTLVQGRQATSGAWRRLDHCAWWRQTATWRPIHVSRDQQAGICQSHVHRYRCWYILPQNSFIIFSLRFNVVVCNLSSSVSLREMTCFTVLYLPNYQMAINAEKWQPSTSKVTRKTTNVSYI